jgi:hypothetical protein
MVRRLDKAGPVCDASYAALANQTRQGSRCELGNLVL